MSQVGNLGELLELYDEYYYNKDESIISDAEYDRIKKIYLRQENKPDYDKVSGYVTTEERVKHDFPILSLTEFESDNHDDIRDAVKKLEYPVMVQPKYDGLTLVIANGKVSTRGDGEYGEDVTENALKSIEGIEALLDSEYQFRGEALILKQDFIKLNEEQEEQGLPLFKNSRNTASGMLRRKHSSPKYIKLFLYDILNTKLCVTEKLSILSAFNSKDIMVTGSMRINNELELNTFLNSLNRTELHNFAFDVDGLVVKSDARNSLEVFGYTNHHPKDSFAIKFPVEGVWTELLGITHQVGRTGKVVPVAELKPVDYMGSTISRATLHNEVIVKSLGLDVLHKGTQVKIIKAKEIIPAIVDVDHKSDGDIIGSGIITRCPICSSLLEYKNELQYCENPSCPTKAKLRLEHMASRQALDIKGLSEATVVKMFQSNLIENPEDIFNLTTEDILMLDGFAEKSANNLYNAIQEVKTEGVYLNNFITSLGIPEVGKGLARDISEYFNSKDEFIEDINNNLEIISLIPGIGNVVLGNIRKNKEYILKMLNIIKIKDRTKETNDNGKKVCISGRFDISKAKITKLLEDEGYTVINNVTKDCDILLSANNTSSKYKRATELGIDIFDDYELLLNSDK